MSEWTPVVVKIEKLEKHPMADALEIAYVMGNYPVITKLGQYKLGDLVSYIPIDSVCDVSLPQFSFLEKPRIKAKRLRGVYSQGLLVDAPAGMVEGDSVQEIYNLKKFVYPEEIEDLMGLSDEEKKKFFFPNIDKSMMPKMRHASAESPPQGWSAPYYDLESLRKYGKLLEEGEEVVCTEKLDGFNFFFRHDGERLWVKSRNLYKKRDEQDAWWQIVIRTDLEEKAAKYPQYGFFGEGYGNVTPFFYDCIIVDGRIQTKFRLFDIFDFSQGKFLDFDEMMKVAQELNIETAPILYRGAYKADKGLYFLAEQDTMLPPVIPQGTKIMEGFVIRPVKERVDPRAGRVVFKLKSEKYNLFKK